MKTKDLRADIRKKSDKELRELVRDSREDLRKERFGISGTKDGVRTRSLKRTIARALTELKGRTN
jgi:ribosomal protein L29